ncbi:MAG TPA: type II toxin-antitoxin system mRNA interferase toxin, RelE/StbE family [Cytophagales bacterium]|nr:type II toxin-antitoxin system mRNA interferase toxin, RelE/StbE family [Cytophagales bacterium]
MVKIIWTDFAIEDLRLIHNYISKDSKLYADRFISKLITRIEQLEKFPQSGRVVPEFDNKILRELIESNYRIIYRIEQNHIGIVRIHHAARVLRDI